MTLIQAHLPVCQFAERHRLLVTAHPADLLDAVTLPGTIDDAWVKRLISWRELPGRFLSRFGSKNALGRRAAFGIGDFTLLGREDDLEIAFGLAGRFWRFDYGLVPLRGPEEFDAMSTAGVPKLVLNFTVEASADGRTWLCTETRVYCNDRSSYFRFLPYWCLIRPVSGLMRRRLLARIRNAAAKTAPSGHNALNKANPRPFTQC
jgi:hypothetical protein